MLFMKRIWLKYFTRKNLVIMMLVGFSLGMLAMAVPVLAMFIIGIVAATLGQGTLRGVFGSIFASIDESRRGEYLGISNAIMSLSMIVGPLLATVLYLHHSNTPFIIAGVLGLLSLFLLPYHALKNS
jgi:MFS family permease